MRVINGRSNVCFAEVTCDRRDDPIEDRIDSAEIA